MLRRIIQDIPSPVHFSRGGARWWVQVSNSVIFQRLLGSCISTLFDVSCAESRLLCRLHSSGNHHESAGVGGDGNTVTQHELHSGLPDVMPVSTCLYTLSCPNAMHSLCCLLSHATHPQRELQESAQCLHRGIPLLLKWVIIDAFRLLTLRKQMRVVAHQSARKR